MEGKKNVLRRLSPHRHINPSKSSNFMRIFYVFGYKNGTHLLIKIINSIWFGRYPIRLCAKCVKLSVFASVCVRERGDSPSRLSSAVTINFFFFLFSSVVISFCAPLSFTLHPKYPNNDRRSYWFDNIRQHKVLAEWSMRYACGPSPPKIELWSTHSDRKSEQ